MSATVHGNDNPTSMVMTTPLPEHLVRYLEAFAANLLQNGPTEFGIIANSIRPLVEETGSKRLKLIHMRKQRQLVLEPVILEDPPGFVVCRYLVLSLLTSALFYMPNFQW